MYRPEESNAIKIESWTGKLNSPTTKPLTVALPRPVYSNHAASRPPTKAPKALPAGTSITSRTTPITPATMRPIMTEGPKLGLFADRLHTTMRDFTELVGPPNKR